MTRVRSWSWAALAGLAVPLALASVPAHAATVAKPWDFDGDGRPDLVIGAPTLNRGSVRAAGGLVVVPGSGSDGAYPDGARIITQSTSKVVGASEPGDDFGAALASADFDADGFADLAVGSPGEDFTKGDDEGAVTILYGSRKGLSGARSQQIAEPSGKHRYAEFGGALAAGDLDGDGYPDLAVGAVDDLVDRPVTDDNPPSGTVTVLRGSRDGVRTSGATVLRGDRGAAWDHRFGSALAVADVDADGRLDLVVVSRGSNDEGAAHDGSLSYCPGTTAGPRACRRLLHDRDLREAGPVVVGNVQGDARPEIVVGVASTDGDVDQGGLRLVRLSGTGSATTGAATGVDQADAGLPGTGDAGDAFGAALAIGDVDGDGYADLVVGAPGEAVGDERAGRVFVVHGGAGGLATRGNSAYDQDTPGVPGGSEDGDRFGAAVALLDRDGDGRADLTVGAPGEDDETGRVTTLLAAGAGFTTTGSRAYGLSTIDNGYDNRAQAHFGEVIGR
ncbi:MAG TPA: FG-GAP-like repeat-containing protein [Friedmanniella sp.]